MLTLSANNTNIPFFPALLKLKREDKLRVIHVLTESMLIPSTEDEKDRTAMMLEKHTGKWAGDESVAEIMTTIKSGSAIREPLSM